MHSQQIDRFWAFVKFVFWFPCDSPFSPSLTSTDPAASHWHSLVDASGTTGPPQRLVGFFIRVLFLFYFLFLFIYIFSPHRCAPLGAQLRTHSFVFVATAKTQWCVFQEIREERWLHYKCRVGKDQFTLKKLVQKSVPVCWKGLGTPTNIA